MDASEFEVRRTSFGGAAELYDRVRPTYPTDAITWMLGTTSRRRVADVGAGTGIFSRLVAGLGHDVIAIEPDREMRTMAEASGTSAVEGSAEVIPLPDASVDAVFAAQAYHWFDKDLFHSEAARVLRQDGVLGVIWNHRDESVDWIRELTSIIGHDGGAESRRFESANLSPRFGPVESKQFRHAKLHSVETLLELVRSRSTYLTEEASARAAMERRVRDVVRGLPAWFELPYLTGAHRATTL